MAGFLINNYLWQPWQVKSQLLAADKQLSDGQNEQGLIALQALHKQDLPLDSRRKAATLMAKAIGNITQSHINKGDYGIAKNMLVDFLKKYGAEIESEDLWEQLNEIRYMQGKSHQQNNNEKLAMVEFLSIDSDSSFYAKAQKSISHIWLELQKKVALESQQKPQSIAALLATAEQLFEKRNYLTPRDNNAYSIYANILARDPGNAVVKDRIESMKSYYYISGKKWCALGEPVTAEIYYRRFLIIEPDNEQILNLIASVDKCKNARPSKRPTPNAAVAAAHEKAIDTSPIQKTQNQNKRKEKVKQLLQKEGVESNWIVEYLFDDPGQNVLQASPGCFYLVDAIL
jgi:tetratricopeptide (TPR) repeat protein